MSAVTNLENTINNDAILDNEKLSILYIATNIAKYSFNYWTTNSNKWKLLNTNNTNTDPGLRYIIVKADIAGGLVGAGMRTRCWSSGLWKCNSYWCCRLFRI